MCDRFVDDSIMDAEDKVSKGFPPHAKFVLGTNENNLAIRPWPMTSVSSIIYFWKHFHIDEILLISFFKTNVFLA